MRRVVGDMRAQIAGVGHAGLVPDRGNSGLGAASLIVPRPDMLDGQVRYSWPGMCVAATKDALRTYSEVWHGFGRGGASGSNPWETNDDLLGCIIRCR
jgi:hypothetical protein